MRLSMFDYCQCIENILNAKDEDEARADVSELMMFIEQLQDEISELTFEKQNLQSENDELNALVEQLQNDWRDLRTFEII